MGQQRAGPGWPFPGRPQDTTRNPKAAPGREHGPQKASLGRPESLPCLLPGPGQAHGEGLPTGGERSPGQKRLRLPFRGRLQPLRPFTCPAQQVDLTRGGCSQTTWRLPPPPSRPHPCPGLICCSPLPTRRAPCVTLDRGGVAPGLTAARVPGRTGSQSPSPAPPGQARL